MDWIMPRSLVRTHQQTGCLVTRKLSNAELSFNDDKNTPRRPFCKRPKQENFRSGAEPSQRHQAEPGATGRFFGLIRLIRLIQLIRLIIDLIGPIGPIRPIRPR